MSAKETKTPKKAKTTVYMTQEEETLLNELFIKRLRERRKTVNHYQLKLVAWPIACKADFKLKSF